MGHLCDEYLNSAHKFIDSVPKFMKQSSAQSICPICVQVKQTWTPASPGSTYKTVHTYSYQGLSIDLSFSGKLSNNNYVSIAWV